MSKTYPNPNPLTVDKIKSGLVFGWWSYSQNECVGKYELKPVDGYSKFFSVYKSGTDESPCNLELLSGGAIEFFTVSIAGTLLRDIKKPSEFCIIQEAPEEQPSKEN